MQYARERLIELDARVTDRLSIVGLDILPVQLDLPGVHIYQESITDLSKVHELLAFHEMDQLDVIMSDAAPNTTGIKDLDASRSIQLIIDTLPLYEQYLKPTGTAVIKVFMGE
jgi:23S rRNA (uridine2552-2'-O)-methyltransferase